MSSLATIIERLSDDHPGWVEVLHGRVTRSVTDVRLIDTVDQIDKARAESLVVFERGISEIVDDYRFDIALRRAAHRNVAAVMVIRRPGQPVSMTAAALARRADITLLGLTADADLATAVRALVQESDQALSLSMSKVRRVCETLLETTDSDPAVLLRDASHQLGRSITVRTQPLDDSSSRAVIAVPLNVADPGTDMLVIDRTGDDDTDLLLEILLWRIAAHATRSAWQGFLHSRDDRRAGNELLLQLTCADPSEHARIIPSAVALDIPVDHWHSVARIEFEGMRSAGRTAPLSSTERESLADAAVEHLSVAAPQHRFHVAHDQSKMIIVCSIAIAPDTATLDAFHNEIDHVLATMVASAGNIRVVCGIGGTHAGSDGLMTSASEARQASSSARLRQRFDKAVLAERVGMRSTLLEWYGSPTVRHAVDQLFEPLDTLPSDRQSSLLHTLTTYLDLGGNTARTADVLHLHRNAVRHRVQRVLGLLDVDEHDMDQRLFVHLACRARVESEV